MSVRIAVVRNEPSIWKRPFSYGYSHSLGSVRCFGWSFGRWYLRLWINKVQSE
jgi:hypothetical protein